MIRLILITLGLTLVQTLSSAAQQSRDTTVYNKTSFYRSPKDSVRIKKLSRIHEDYKTRMLYIIRDKSLSKQAMEDSVRVLVHERKKKILAAQAVNGNTRKPK